MDVQDLNHHSFCLHSYLYHLQLHQQSLHFLITSTTTYDKYRAVVNYQTIKNSKNLQFFFNSPQELFHYFKNNSGNHLQLASNGDITFIIQMNLGKSIKSFECIIQTVKEEIKPEERLRIKFQQLDKELQCLKQQNERLKSRYLSYDTQIEGIKQQVEQCIKIIAVKDQIITNVFKQLKDISQWKEIQEKRSIPLIKNKFSPDYSNPHNKKFQQTGNKFKKICGGTWDALFSENAILKNQIHRYHIKQLRAGSNGSFMYGIGSEAVKGINRAQDNKEFIGYYQNTGFIFEEGSSRKGGPKVKNGEIVTIEVDTKKWKVIWYIEGKKQAEATISKQLREKPLYLVLVVYNEQSEIQFI